MNVSKLLLCFKYVVKISLTHKYRRKRLICTCHNYLLSQTYIKISHTLLITNVRLKDFKQLNLVFLLYLNNINFQLLLCHMLLETNLSGEYNISSKRNYEFDLG